MTDHHAWIMRASSLEAAPIPVAYQQQSVDVLHIVRDRFSIDDARELSAQAQQTPFQGNKRVFVIGCNALAVEAQNALLKLFEEPPVHALFYVVVPQTAQLLPTLESRLQIVKQSDEGAHADDHFKEFAQASYAERLLRIAQKTKEKDVQWIEAIVRGVEKVAHEERSKQLLQAVLFTRKYIETKGASAKMLLEELALLLPVL